MIAARAAVAALLWIGLYGCGSGDSESHQSTRRPSDTTPSSITVYELHELAGGGRDIFLIDVRSEREYRQSRLAFADAHVPYDSLEQYSHLLPADTGTVIYCFCYSGRRSAIAAARLATMGYGRTVNIEGGIKAWLAAGYPVTTEAAEADSP